MSKRFEWGMSVRAGKPSLTVGALFPLNAGHRPAFHRRSEALVDRSSDFGAANREESLEDEDEHDDEDDVPSLDKPVEFYSVRVKVTLHMNTPIENAQFRQGDVLIESVAEIPDAAKAQEKSRQVTLAYGEMTGHKHVLETEDPADWWKLEEAGPRLTGGLEASDIFLSIPAGGTVSHPEHAPIQLAPGLYRVTHQREYSPAAIRRVAD